MNKNLFVPSEQIFEPDQLSVQEVRENTGTPYETALIKDALFGTDADTYILLMLKYHNFMYLFTHDFNRILKSQFQRIFDMPESTSRKLFKRLKNAKVIGDGKYAGNHFIYPLYRGFKYSAQQFIWDKKVPGSINKDAQEPTLLREFHKVEYWLQTNTVLSDNLHFFNPYEGIFYPRELSNREDGFDYHFTALEWVVKEELSQYKNKECKEAFDEVEQIINREEPVFSKEEAIANAEPEDIEVGQSGMVFLREEAENERRKNNEKLERFCRMDQEYQMLYYNIIMKALLTNLLNKNAYVTRIKNTKMLSKIELVVLHNAKTHWSTYNNLMTQIQRIYCFQTQSLKINITIVAENEDDREEAEFLWEKAINERTKQDGVNFERRARKNMERKKKGEPIRRITENDIKKYVMQGTKYCETNQVKFISLQLDHQFTNELYRKPEGILKKKSFEELMKSRGSV